MPSSKTATLSAMSDSNIAPFPQNNVRPPENVLRSYLKYMHIRVLFLVANLGASRVIFFSFLECVI